MATEESSRQTHMLRIFNPDDSSQFVDVKVIDQINLVAEQEQYWEYQFSFANDPGGTTRTIRTQKVVGSDSSSHVSVERIGIAQFIIAEEQHWEQQWDLGGNDASNEPETFHYEQRKVKIFGRSGGGGDPDNPSSGDGHRDTDIWVIMQRLVTLDVIREQDQYWEEQYNLNWPDPQGDAKGTQDPDDVVNPDQVIDGSYNPDKWAPKNAGAGVQPPYRFDPFQNLIDVHWGGGLAVEFYPQGT